MIKLTISLFIIIIFSQNSLNAELPTLYEYYTNGSITSGLISGSNGFTLNGKDITLLSGEMHYFRVHQNNWRPILERMKSAGLNTIQFYSPWNLHEEIPGNFDFETGILNISDFLTAIREADMFAMYRPGPYICAEWEFGGLPAWLLRDSNMNVRSMYKPYIKAVERYWKQLFDTIRGFQFTVNGGPIIGVQIENEFGSLGNTAKSVNDLNYIKTLGSIAKKYGIQELLFTSDGPQRSGSSNEYLQTINFNKNSLNNLMKHKKANPSQALYVAEYWIGWFDRWGAKYHNTQNVTYFAQQFDEIVFQMNSSFNAYMFIGGTNFGFMAGNVGTIDSGVLGQAFITSYDYDSPLTESGNYTIKYWKIKQLIQKFNDERKLPKLRTQLPPPINKAANYGVINITEKLSLSQVLKYIKPFQSKTVVSMENINLGPNFGQNYGFTLYRTVIPISKVITFSKGKVNDRAAISVNDIQIDILVENMGRVGFTAMIKNMTLQRKGLNEDIIIDSKVQNDWHIYALELKKQFIDNLKNEKWEPIGKYLSPAFYRTYLTIDDSPQDTYIKFDNNWTTCVVFVNGFNLGRYWNVGPQRTLYIPSPILRKGSNDIILFETQKNGYQIELIETPILG
ncbi:beta-galactosidase-1-like protein 3 [Oppia nitens]|uniref:beta-galactosidase-1-like protein 3 n=1 Tax=Oppia nitens TaxID=1686743 RepID=UPI0023DAD196|nr:beta-galactosidase-1-like protein 3 [Oppia nitens]